MPATTHAEHFLARVDRLSTGHAELALGLYRDHELVRFVLSQQALGDGSDRVAISLSEGDRGPYIIVTRDGKFVTCLGDGMTLRPDQPLITRRALDGLSSKIDALRTLIQDSTHGKSRHCDQLIQRVIEAGHGVTQGEFDDLVIWSPLVGHWYVTALFTSLRALEKSYRRLALVRRVGKRSAHLVEAYWRALWSALHFTSLVGAQPEHLERAFDGLDDGEARPELLRAMFILPMWQTGLMPWALRASWLAARLPKAFLKRLKVCYDRTELAEGIHGYGVSLAAIGHRHQRYQKEIAKFLRRPESEEASPLDQFRAVAGRLLTRGYDAQARSALMGLPVQEAEAFMQELAAFFGDMPEERERFEQMPSTAKLAMMLSMPLSVAERESDFSRILYHLPATARMDARDFYVPAEYRSTLLTRSYSLKLAMAYARPRLEWDKRAKPGPSRAPARPGRNASCPCGSGKKYKRCCGVG